MSNITDWGRPVGSLRVPFLFLVLAAIDGGFGVLHLGDRVLGMPFGPQITRLIDLDQERNIPTWYSSMKLFVVGTLLLVLAHAWSERREPGVWVMTLLAVAFLGMSLDEFSGIHERLGLATDRLLPGGHRSNTVFRSTGIWMFVIGIPVFAVLLWMVLRLRKLWDDARATRIFLVGLSVFIGSATLLDLLQNFTAGRTRWLQVTAEECGEMLGVTIILWAVYELFVRHGIELVHQTQRGQTEVDGGRSQKP